MADVSGLTVHVRLAMRGHDGLPRRRIKFLVWLAKMLRVQAYMATER